MDLVVRHLPVFHYRDNIIASRSHSGKERLPLIPLLLSHLVNDLGSIDDACLYQRGSQLGIREALWLGIHFDFRQRNTITQGYDLLHGDMLEPLPGPVDFIVANLPYVKQSQLRADGFEPLLALDGGRDGLERIRQLCRQVSNRLRSGGCLLLEIGQGQEGAVTTLLNGFLPAAEIEVMPDLAGIDRVLTAVLPPVLKT